jgi:hypothetical protein
MYGVGDERTAAMKDLLVRETVALQDIEKRKVAAMAERTDERTRQFLELMARPQKWQLSSGTVAMVDTPQTLRAADLLSLYDELSAPVTSVNRRLDLLSTVRETVSVHQTPLGSDIASLVLREEDLLGRNRAVRSMDKLRIRLANLFLQYIEDPSYSSIAAGFVAH